MIIETLTLYKTKLNNDYTDVIDTGPQDTLTNETLKTSVFDVFYYPMVVYANEAKSGRESNATLYVSITKRYEDIQDYNYVIINNGVKNFYYFITNMSSINDSNNPITELTLERDAWCNNINYFTNRIYADRQNVIRSHKERFYDDGQNNFYPYYYLTDDTTNVRKYENITFKNVGGASSVAWCGVRVSPDAKLNVNGELVEMHKTGYTGCVPTEASAPIFYFPLCIVTDVQDGIPNYNYNFTWNGTQLSNNNNLRLRKIMNFFSDIFLEAFITLYPPFPYTSTTNSVTTSNLTIASATLFDTDGTPVYNDDETMLNPLALLNANSSANFTFTHTFDNELTNFNIQDNVGSVVFDAYANMDSVLYYEPRIYCSPFVDISFLCSKFTDNYTPSFKTTTHTATLSAGFRTSPSVRTTFGNAVKGEGQVETIGRLVTTPNKFDSFLQNSLMSTFLGAVSGAVGGVAGGPVGMAAGALGGIASGAINTFGGYNAIMNSTTQPTVPSVFATNNIKDMLPQYKITKWADKEDILNIVSELYLYGYRYNEAKSIKSNCRLWYDYCQTEKCNLPDIKNIFDRRKIEQAFDRGVTKWHFDVSGFGLNSDFDKTRNNPERKYVNSNDAQFYYNFVSEDNPLENRGTLGNGAQYDAEASGITIDRQLGAIADNSNSYLRIPAISSTDIYNSNFVYAISFKITNVPNEYNNSGQHWISRMATTSGTRDVVYNNNPSFSFGCLGAGNNDYTLNDFVGKTLTIVYNPAGAITYKMTTKVFIDGVKIIDTAGSKFLGNAGTNHIFYLIINALPNVSISKFKMWYFNGEGSYGATTYKELDEAWVKTKLL